MFPLRLALAQLNVTVGDCEGNGALIASAIRRARAWFADLVVVPELAIPGYPPEDLLFRPQFIEANLRTLARLAPVTRGLTALVGFADRDARGRLYNAAAVLADGRHAATYRKQCLPNYGVFDERRYFTSGSESVILDAGGVRLGVTICEDLWERFPCQALAESGAQLIVNLSASPYHAGKLGERERLFSERARRHGVAIAYCNVVGGQDELVFDGASLVLDARGRAVACGAQCREDLVLCDLSAGQMGRDRPGGVRGGNGRRELRAVRIPPASRARPGLPGGEPRRFSEAEEVYEALLLGLRDYVRKNGFSSAVLGLSGGVDSALTACLASDALGPARVCGVVMPSRFSSADTQADAKRVARALGIELLEIAIEPVFRAYLKTVRPFFRGRRADVTEQNLQARIRGNLLMALSNKFGWLVLTTGNKSETATGYCTLYGDMAGGFAVIKDVPKMLVYRLAAFRNRRGPGSPIPSSVLRRPPTAELAPNQRDEDTLPPYHVLDRLLSAYVEEDRSLREILRTVHVASGVVRQVLRMVDRSEYKRRQSPPGIKITPRAFGKDRRMPITNRFQETASTG